VSDSTIHQDVQDTDDTGFEAFLSSFNDDAKKRPSEGDEGAPEPQDETPAQTENTEGEPEGSEQAADPDDQEFEVKVGEETKKATLRELKRLFGQEAALTQKSQKASEQQRVAEANIARAVALHKGMTERAQARYQPFAELGAPEWAQLAANLQPEQYNALREEAASAKEHLDFLTKEGTAFMQEQQNQALQAHHVAAQECVKVLSDPATGIEGWGEPLYNEMVAYAAEMGIPQARQSTSPAEYKILHKAMMYDRAQKAAKEAEAKAKKAVEQPTRVMKPGKSSKPDGKKVAMDKLRATGDLDDAAAAFMTTF